MNLLTGDLGKTASVEHRNVPGFPGYRVGSDGSVWSHLDTGGNELPHPHRMTPRRMRNGYLMVGLSRSGHKTRFLVHRLVLIVFIGPCPEGMEGCHDDGNRANNHLANLRWDTPKGNCADKVRHGTNLEGERHHNAKVTDEDVKLIRERYASGGVTFEDLAAEFGVQKANIGHIVSGRAWRHLPVVPCDTSTRGSRNGSAKLSEADAVEIRRLYATGRWKQAELAAKFGITPQTVSRVCRGELWKNTEAT